VKEPIDIHLDFAAEAVDDPAEAVRTADAHGAAAGPSVKSRRRDAQEHTDVAGTIPQDADVGFEGTEKAHPA
jgi:hypothetical protein